MSLRNSSVRVATKSLKRVQGEKEKKIPVTIGMLEWLADNLRLGQRGKPCDRDEVRVWIAIVLGHFSFCESPSCSNSDKRICKHDVGTSGARIGQRPIP
jgi:hypothetical protein